MDDLISRRTALDAVYERIKQIGYENSLSILSIGQVIRDLPSAQPPYQYSEAYVHQIRGERDILQDMVDNITKPKTGEWIEEDEYGDLLVCSECGFANDYKDDYCPSCKARMKGDTTE